MDTQIFIYNKKQEITPSYTQTNKWLTQVNDTIMKYKYENEFVFHNR